MPSRREFLKFLGLTPLIPAALKAQKEPELNFDAEDPRTWDFGSPGHGYYMSTGGCTPIHFKDMKNPKVNTNV